MRNQTTKQKSHQRDKYLGRPHLVRYSGSFVKWTRKNLQQIDQNTRKLMTMQKDLCTRYDVDRMFVSRKKMEEKDSLALKIASIHRYND